MVTFVILLDSE
uniref:Uncharacterized protein n=1 Tax=Anguilla anguilla TaxID=7936 RepID=A0A0E9QUN4_ANGAN